MAKVSEQIRALKDLLKLSQIEQPELWSRIRGTHFEIELKKEGKQQEAKT